MFSCMSIFKACWGSVNLSPTSNMFINKGGDVIIMVLEYCGILSSLALFMGVEYVNVVKRDYLFIFLILSSILYVRANASLTTSKKPKLKEDAKNYMTV